ncbi:MAG: hypothetical protein DME44_09630 [Verrucomicrobia bacterium]|nr:MAG: hypothetical protein DME44_09630 [Verrucomicrobiota bacterium]
MQRRYPIGAEIISESQTHFRVWAPKGDELQVVLETSADKSAERTFHSLARESDGYFSGTVSCGAGTRYRFRLNGSENLHPDPASRFQPEGPHGSSYVVDPFGFKWTDANWPGVKLPGQVIYEFHVGTFTPDGTWRGAAEKLELLKNDGITSSKVIPLAFKSGNLSIAARHVPSGVNVPMCIS